MRTPAYTRNAPSTYITQEKCLINSAPSAIITPRMASAPTTPHSRRRCCRRSSTANARKITRKRNRLSTLRFFDQVAGKEFEGRLGATEIEHSESKEHG